jgi:WD40 repeat protein
MTSIDHNQDASLSQALLLAIEAVKATWETDGYVTPQADNALCEAIDKASPWHMSLPRHRHANWSSFHGDAATRAMDLCSDNNLVATVGSDTTVRIWDANTGEQLHLLLGHTASTVAVSFNPDGKSVASGGEDGTLRIWEVKTGQQTQVLQCPLVENLAFSPDGMYLLVESYNWSQVLNTEKWQQVYNFNQFGGINKMSFSPDGRFILTLENGDVISRLNSAPISPAPWHASASARMRTFSATLNCRRCARTTTSGSTCLSDRSV